MLEDQKGHEVNSKVWYFEVTHGRQSSTVWGPVRHWNCLRDWRTCHVQAFRWITSCFLCYVHKNSEGQNYWITSSFWVI